ncbi:MAG TPA: TetR-like C-terminal domain-containing protein [Mobilitalea sp.]|nr:TetR-like C-terminal domain-containing protein [Mobilitalea sp.]
MIGKENQRIKLTKVLLKKSLIELMHSKPINKITIKELCENADINRSTFYLYYTDQFALLEEIEKELLLRVQQHLQKIDSSSDSQSFLIELLRYIKDNADIFKTLLCHQENLSFQSTFIDATIKNLKFSLKLNCPENISYYIYNYLIMGCLSIIKQWIEADFDLSCEYLANMIYQLSDKAASIYVTDDKLQ